MRIKAAWIKFIVDTYLLFLNGLLKVLLSIIHLNPKNVKSFFEKIFMKGF